MAEARSRELGHVATAAIRAINARSSEVSEPWTGLHPPIVVDVLPSLLSG